MSAPEQPTTPTEPAPKKTTAMAIIGRPDIQPIIPTTFAQVMTIAQSWAQTELVPKDLRGKPDAVAIVLMKGLELGLPPGMALANIYVVEGRPTLAADLMVGLVLASSACKYFRCLESTEERAVYETQRVGEQPFQLEWTMKFASEKGINRGREGIKANWDRYGRAMLRHRCSSELARLKYPDVVAGLYVADEIDDVGDEVSVYSAPPASASKAQRMTAVTQQPSAPAEHLSPYPETQAGPFSPYPGGDTPAQQADTETVVEPALRTYDELAEAMGRAETIPALIEIGQSKDFAALTKPEQDALRNVYNARRAKLKAGQQEPRA